MKQGESDFDILGIKRNTITPSTAYSFSESPEIIQNKTDALAKNLALMQNQFAIKLNQQIKYLGLKIPVLHNRNDLADLNLEKIRKNKEIIRSISKKLERFSNEAQRVYDVDIDFLEENNKKEWAIYLVIQKDLKEMIKKVKNCKTLERKEILLNHKIIILQNKVEKMKQYKKELSENLSEIDKGQNQVADFIMFLKIKLESLIASKEDLLNCIPQIQRPCSKLESLKFEINEIKSLNFELRQLLLSHEFELNDIVAKNNLKSADYNKYLSNFHSREVLMKVQARFLEEKIARIDLTRRELEELEKSLYIFTSNTPKANQTINPILNPSRKSNKLQK